MLLKTEFDEFLTAIRPTPNQRGEMADGHGALRRRLQDDAALSKLVVSTFLQGSYRRHTANRPNGDRKSDVDIIAVTTLSENQFKPAEAMALFEPFLNQHYKGKWQPQGRSFGIELSYVKLDLVITSAPSESERLLMKSEAVTVDEDALDDWRLNDAWLGRATREARADSRRILEVAKAKPEWKLVPLRIPDREAAVWDDTHPLEQLQWTRDKNAKTSGLFINVVKSLKWWRADKFPEAKHPKGFPLERMIGDCCPDAIESVAEGIVLTLEGMVSKYAGGKPDLRDYGVPGHDVLRRLSNADFSTLYEQVEPAARLAREAYDSTDRVDSGKKWRDLLGNKFPKVEDSGPGRGPGSKEPPAPADPDPGRFA